LEDLANRWSNLLHMVESNYQIYHKHLFGRRSSSKRITLILALMVAVIVIGTALVKCFYYRKVVGFLREKKAV
jgi:hypothetical protein